MESQQVELVLKPASTAHAAVAAPLAHAAVASSSRRTGWRLALFASIVIAFLAASAAPTPLYQRYNDMWHGTALTTTVAFGIYAVAVLVGLLSLGEFATHFGRRAVLLAALASQSVAVVMFATAVSFTPLLIGRVVQGLATGMAIGTIGAAMIETHRARGTIASSAAPAVGTGSGALVAGLVVAYLPWPTHLIYATLLVVFVAQFIAVALVLGPHERRAGAFASLRPRVSLPPPARAAFLTVAPVMFAAWALAGFYGSLGPALARQLASSTSIALGGLPLFVLAGSAAVTVVALQARSARALTTIGVVGLVVGVVGTIVGTLVGSPILYFAATAVAGVGFGAGFQGGLRTVLPLAEPAQRAGLLSAAFVVSYLGMGVPAVIAGFLVSKGDSLQAVTVGYATGLIALALVAAAGLARRPVAHGAR